MIYRQVVSLIVAWGRKRQTRGELLKDTTGFPRVAQVDKFPSRDKAEENSTIHFRLKGVIFPFSQQLSEAYLDLEKQQSSMRDRSKVPSSNHGIDFTAIHQASTIATSAINAILRPLPADGHPPRRTNASIHAPTYRSNSHLLLSTSHITNNIRTTTNTPRQPLRPLPIPRAKAPRDRKMARPGLLPAATSGASEAGETTWC